MKNLISVSSAPIARLGHKEYYDLFGTIEVMKKVLREGVVDGFKLQLEPKWDNENAPLTNADWSDWSKTPKFTAEEVVELIRSEDLPILSVHASRDVGAYLCSEKKLDREKGKRVVHEALSSAEALGAGVCVLHLWDTWKRIFDLQNLTGVFLKEAERFPKVKASVENIPTHLDGHSPLMLVKSFKHVTFDLRWAVMYNELESFKSIVGRITNVHLRGTLKRNRWVLERSGFDFYDVLNKIRSDWKYSGLLTVEPEGGIASSSFGSFIRAMRSLRK